MVNVTPLVLRFAAGSRSACNALFGRAWPGQVHVARRALRRDNPGHGDAEDLAQIVLHRLWSEVRVGTPICGQLTGTRGLLDTLHLLTRQCIGTLRRDARRAKRDAARTLRWEDGTGADVPTRETPPQTPELPPGLTDRQRRIATLLFEGWLRTELPAVLGCSLSTVDRELRSIRDSLIQKPC